MHASLLFLSLARASAASASVLPRVHCDTTKGPVVIVVHPLWAPLGAAHFLELVEQQYFSQVLVFRVNDWIAQFGAQQYAPPFAALQRRTIGDDPRTDCPVERSGDVESTCVRGRLFNGAVSFAGGGAHSRGAQMFFVHNIADQPIGGEVWEVPFAEVTPASLDVVRSFYSYGDGAVSVQSDIMERGSARVLPEYPKMDLIRSCVDAACGRSLLLVEARVSLSPSALPVSCIYPLPGVRLKPNATRRRGRWRRRRRRRQRCCGTRIRRLGKGWCRSSGTLRRRRRGAAPSPSSSRCAARRWAAQSC